MASETIFIKLHQKKHFYCTVIFVCCPLQDLKYQNQSDTVSEHYPGRLCLHLISIQIVSIQTHTGCLNSQIPRNTENPMSPMEATAPSTWMLRGSELTSCYSGCIHLTDTLQF